MLEINVVSEPAQAIRPHRDHYFWDIDLARLTSYDEALVKPALLVADRVRLTTFRQDMSAMVRSDAFRNSEMLLRYVQAFAGVALRRDPLELDVLGLKESDLCPREEAEGVFAGGVEPVFTFQKRYWELINKHRQAYARLLRSRHDALNSSGLLMASEAGILSVEPWLSTELSDVELSFVDVVEEYLPNAVLDLGRRLMTSRAVPLLEPGAHSVFLSGEGEAPAFQAAATGPALDRRAMVAAALAAQLPDLRLVPIDEVIGLRAALKDYLPAFRLEVVKLADEIAANGALDATQLATEVEKRWERDLAPQLQEIREKVRTLAYPRKLLASLVEDKGTLSATASSVVLAVGSVYAGVGTLLPAAAAATYPLLKALNETLSDRDEARRNRLYFLYGAQERLRRRRRDSRLEEAT